MEWLCRFGPEGCGVEDVFAIVGFFASVVLLIAGVVGAMAYVRASAYSRPVVIALKTQAEESQNKIAVLEKQNESQASELNTMRELVTQAAAVERFRIESKEDHEKISTTLERVGGNLAIQTRILGAIARKLEVEIRKDDLF